MAHSEGWGRTKPCCPMSVPASTSFRRLVLDRSDAEAHPHRPQFSRNRVTLRAPWRRDLRQLWDNLILSLSESAQKCSKLADSGLISRSRPLLHRFRPRWGRNRHGSAEFRTKSTKAGPISATSAPKRTELRANPGPTHTWYAINQQWTEFGQVRAEAGQVLS